MSTVLIIGSNELGGWGLHSRTEGSNISQGNYPRHKDYGLSYRPNYYYQYNVLGTFIIKVFLQLLLGRSRPDTLKSLTP